MAGGVAMGLGLCSLLALKEFCLGKLLLTQRRNDERAIFLFK
jgi:hypothetical protein